MTRKVYVLDNISKTITKDGVAELGDGYVKTEELQEAEAVLVRASSMHELSFGKYLRCISRSGAGFNNIPIDLAAKQGIVVFNTPGGNANAVKELVCGMLLMNSRKTMDGIRWVDKNAANPDIVALAERTKKAFVGREAEGRKVGIVGLGAVGSKVANALVHLGCEVYGYDPYVSVEHAWQLSRSVKRVETLDELVEGAAYVTLHVPAKEDTIGMIGEHELSRMEKGAMLINYARADIIQEDAVLAALRSGQLGSFVCDFATPKTCQMPNTIITPHMGACTQEAESNCAHMAVAQMKNYLEWGTIKNSVNYPSCDLGPLTQGSRIAALHANIPNMIGQITAVLAASESNIERMANEAKGEVAYTLIDIDKDLDEQSLEKLRSIDGIFRIRTFSV